MKTDFLAKTIAIGWIAIGSGMVLAQSERPPLHIGQFLAQKSGQDLVYIPAGSEEGIVIGSIYQSKRARSGRPLWGPANEEWIQTGEIKVVEVRDHWSIGLVTLRSLPVAATMFGKYPFLMAGDRLVLKPMELAQRLALTPHWVIRYSDLFADPRPHPESYELSIAGKELLMRLAKELGPLTVPRLSIEGYSDHIGQSDINQSESLQRSLAVKQFLIDQAQFRSDRLEAFGLGEANLLVEDFAPGHGDRNRRIEIRALTVPFEDERTRLSMRDMREDLQSPQW